MLFKEFRPRGPMRRSALRVGGRIGGECEVYARRPDMSLLSMPGYCYYGKDSFSIGALMETLDKFDSAILKELQADGRLTNAELAQRVGLSAAPCWRRVRALEQAGYIKGYHAEIDRHKIGLGVLAFVRLDANRNTGELTREMEEAIRKIPEIVSCHYISGAGTFELQVVSRDLDTFSQFARKVLINLPNVKDLHTSFSLGEVKASSSLPLAHLGTRTTP
jgi:Lrp/AsnC family transcriptional regulator, leucine-responsive regulatory protein